MGDFQIRQIGSVKELRDCAGLWDDLWQRSKVTLPTARAELLAQWIEEFVRCEAIRIFVVESGGQWVAALPLLRTRVRRVLSAGGLCGSTWMPGGPMLLDADVDPDAVLDTLVTTMRELPWQLLWLANVNLDAPRWKAFQRALDRTGVPYHVDVEWQSAWIPVEHDWDAFQARWSPNHRRNLRRGIRQLENAGVRFELHSRLRSDQVEPLLYRGFEIEDRSWKGAAGTSVIRSGHFGYVVRQAQQLAAWDALELAFLESNDGPIAFCYGFRQKNVHFAVKIGYDPHSVFARLGPSRLLWYYYFERLHANPQCLQINFFGKLTEAISQWKPSSSPMGRIVIAPGRMLGRIAMAVYNRRNSWPTPTPPSDATT